MNTIIRSTQSRRIAQIVIVAGAITIGIAGTRAIANEAVSDAVGAKTQELLKNLDHDSSCMCLGEGNEFNKIAKPVQQFQTNAIKDLTQGPGSHNDLVGREGFVRKHILGF
jgi:hypothetical protein